MLALVLRRSDVRESSRLVTLLSRERGKFTVLAKGAYRPDSTCLGRVDFLNRVEVSIAGRGMPLLGTVRLVHEPRALREPPRFLLAAHFAELLDAAFVPDRVDVDLFDLATGGLTLIERAPRPSLPCVLAGLELRFLRALGVLGATGSCGACGAPPGHDGALWFSARRGDLACEAHRGPLDQEVSGRALAVLAESAEAGARELASRIPRPGTGEALGVLGTWVEHALEFRPRFRRMALDALSAGRSIPSTGCSSIAT